MSIHTGLEADQVVLEAANRWDLVMYTTTKPEDELQDTAPAKLRGFSAMDALKRIRDLEYPDDLFWDTADLDTLETMVIAQIDRRLAPNSSYQQVLLLRNS